ncbi:uncharacterized protein [Drosophila takahashii]|uniref:uncharacterized protein n=1 Tax=Drosophila takahashii TaxID=29030 RepID=UPI0007E89BD4|nr:uncharacterized protein LOC108054859 [Drosophila takahashii]
MAKTMTLWFLVVVTLNPTCLIKINSASMLLLLDRQNAEHDHSWAHLLPINFYSEMNQQYFRRFRRQAGVFGTGKRNQHPFEYARYV